MSTVTTTGYTTSTDGTRIAYDVRGTGPLLVLVDGALCYRGMGPSEDLAEALQDRFTVVRYDRRGRGESGPADAPVEPATVDREVEDLLAVVGAHGDTASVLALSSGAALALEAARRGAPFDHLVCYEAPFVLDGTHPATDPDFTAQVERLVQDGRPGAAVSAFMRLVGVPAPFRLLMRALPVWKRMLPVAQTLPYDLAMVVPFGQGRALPAGYYAGVTVPTLVVAGGKSPAYLRNAQAAIAAAVPGGEHRVLAGQTHMVKASALSPLVTEHCRA